MDGDAWTVNVIVRSSPTSYKSPPALEKAALPLMILLPLSVGYCCAILALLISRMREIAKMKAFLMHLHYCLSARQPHRQLFCSVAVWMNNCY